MFDGMIGLFSGFVQDFWKLDIFNKLQAVAVLAAPVMAGTKYIHSRLNFKSKELEQLHALNQTLTEKAQRLDLALKEREQQLHRLEAQFPEHWLKQAAKEREGGNEERAIRGLRLGFESLREPLAAVCVDLAGHHFALASDYGAAQFGEAERLARLAALLNPADKDAQTFLLEILAVAPEGHYAAGDHAGFDTLWEEAEDFLGVGDDPASIASIEDRARQHYEQGHYRLAVRLFRRLAQMSQRHFGPDSQTTLNLKNSLSLALGKAGSYSEALALAQAVLAGMERIYGPDDPDVATSLNNLAALYEAQGQYAQAEPLYRRSLAIKEKALGPDHPDVATSLNNLAALYQAQGQYAKAEPLYQRSLGIWENSLGSDHPDVAISLNNLAALYQAQGQYAQVEPLFQRSLAISEQALGTDHPDVAISLNNLAVLFEAQGQCAQAEPLYQRALAIFEKALGPHHPDVVPCLRNYAALLRKLDRAAEAEALEARAQAIEAKQPPGPAQAA